MIDDFENVPPVLFVALEEDFDPTIVDEIFSLYTPYPEKLQSFLNFTIEKGIEEAASMGQLIHIANLQKAKVTPYFPSWEPARPS